MQDAALIKIKVTEKDDGITYGTAYLINQGYAITALHVVQDYKAIEFHFSNGVKIIEHHQFSIPYQHNDYDLAILCFTSAADVSLPDVGRTFIGISPEVDDKWHGTGYPKFAENNKARPPEELKGDCYRLGDGAFRIELGCDKTPKIAEWGGVSGAPVFLNKNNYLIAVITQHDKALENTHFKAAPLSALFGISEFTNYFIDSSKADKLTQLTLSLLQENESLLKALNSESPQEVIDSFKRDGIEDFFEVIESLSESVDQHLVSKFTLHFLPHFFVDQSVLIDQSLLGSDLVNLDCVKDVSAECAMASFAGRAANLSCDEKSDNLPYISKGKYALGPETGIGNDDSDLQTLTNQLLSSCAIEDVSKSSSSLDINLQGRLAKFSLGKTNASEYVNRKLERDRAKGKYYYYLVSLSDDSINSDDHKEKIKLFKTTYPLLIFINLRKRDDLPINEGVLYEYLPELITA